MDSKAALAARVFYRLPALRALIYCYDRCSFCLNWLLKDLPTLNADYVERVVRFSK